MERNDSLREDTRNSFFNILRKDQLDDSTFGMWKSELQKELPNFWEELNSVKRR